MIHLNHPHIISVAHADTESLYLEYIEGSPFTENSLNPQQALPLFVQIADALCYLHENDYVHLDLHGANILVTTDKKTAKLIDFGQSQKNPDSNEFQTDTKEFINLIENWIKNTKTSSTNKTVFQLKTLVETYKTSSQKPTIKEIHKQLLAIESTPPKKSLLQRLFNN